VSCHAAGVDLSTPTLAGGNRKNPENRTGTLYGILCALHLHLFSLIANTDEFLHI
jgi:hypothetical protein